MVFPTDWVVNKEDASTVTVNDASTPIAGVASLQTQIVNAGPVTERMTLQNSTYTNGITEGRMRAKMRVDTMSSIDSQGYVGFACMQNSPTVFTGTDQGYGVIVSAGTGLSAPAVSIIKWTTGFPTFPVVLDSVSVPGLLIGQSFVFQMDWVFDLGLLGGTILRGYIGTNTTDFNDLIEVVTFTDTIAPLVFSVTESLLHANINGATGPDFDVKWDDVSIFTLT